MTIEGEVVFVLAYSGGGRWEVFFDLDFLSPDSGVVFSKTFEGVSFRTGLRG